MRRSQRAANIAKKWKFINTNTNNNEMINEMINEHLTELFNKKLDTFKKQIDKLNIESTNKINKMIDKKMQDYQNDDLLIRLYQKIRKFNGHKNKQYYADILGVNVNDEKSIIRRRYKELIILMHPDKNAKIDQTVASIVYNELTEANNAMTTKS